VVKVKALRGLDCIRALLGWPKIGLRRFGSRCFSIHPEYGKETEMDIGQFASNWVKPDDVRDAPIVTRIVAVLMNEKLQRPMLELETGSQFTLFERNVDALIKAWGRDTDEWPGYEVELSHETYTIKKSDGSTEEKEGVKICPISPRKAPSDANGTAAKPLPPTRQQLRDEMADDLPF
jgi:hypothetical protein